MQARTSHERSVRLSDKCVNCKKTKAPSEKSNPNRGFHTARSTAQCITVLRRTASRRCNRTRANQQQHSRRTRSKAVPRSAEQQKSKRERLEQRSCAVLRAV